MIFLSDFIVLCDAQVSEDYGCVPEERPIGEYLARGIVIIDKPAGPTSHEVDGYVRDILKINRVGHGGTLDPKVTGVLPVALGGATKALELLLLSQKEYVCLMRLHKPVSYERVLSVLDEFTGKIYQLPPVKSAVKRQLRVRSVYGVDVLDFEGGQDVLFRIRCESGTYIRKFCHDVGEVLGCGAHMAELRRTRTGPFGEDCLVTLQDLRDAYVFFVEDGDESYLRSVVQPVEAATCLIKKVFVKDSAVDAVCHGADLACRGVVSLDGGICVGDTVCVMTLKGELLAVGTSLLDADSVGYDCDDVFVNIHKVFIEPMTYPMMWK